jgi:hypothetical protein
MTQDTIFGLQWTAALTSQLDMYQAPEADYASYLDHFAYSDEISPHAVQDVTSASASMTVLGPLPEDFNVCMSKNVQPEIGFQTICPGSTIASEAACSVSPLLQCFECFHRLHVQGRCYLDPSKQILPMPDNDGPSSIENLDTPRNGTAISERRSSTPHEFTRPCEDQGCDSASSSPEHDATPKSSPPRLTTSRKRKRKRKRLPHTAVERRYRVNLNAHLEILRNKIPSLAACDPLVGQSAHDVIASSSYINSDANGVAGQHRLTETYRRTVAGAQMGAKPSKCEILKGAIQHIAAVEQENRFLRAQFQELKSSLAFS